METDEQQNQQTSMTSAVPRQVAKNSHGYLEVSPEYRAYRSRLLKNQEDPGDRIRCPVVDAGRSERVYGVASLQDTSAKTLVYWGKAVGVDSGLMLKAIAYMSAPPWLILRNILFRRFDDKQINTGTIAWLKDGINTGFLHNEHFNQHAFADLIVHLYPDLKGKPLDTDTLYSNDFATRYIVESDGEKMVAYNKQRVGAGGLRGWIGASINRLELKSLLLGIIGQRIKLEEGSEPVQAILIRDLYDFYRFGWYPAHIEARMEKSGLIQF